MVYTTLQKEVPVIADYDVVVCGGGPAGIMAAIASARGGAKTALIERYGFVGGMATAGMVAPISVFRYNNELVVGGVPWEFVKRMEEANGAYLEMPLGNVSFQPEVYKLIAQRMLLEAGVDLYLHAYLSDCMMEDNEITHVIIESKSGTEAIAAKYFIDATGDADLAHMAGVPMISYDAPKQPASLYFMLSGVDINQLEKIHHNEQGVNYHIIPLQEKLRELAAVEDVPNFGGPWMCYMLSDNTVLVNMTRVEADMINQREQTRAECVLREDAFKLVELLKNHVDEFKDAYIINTATQAGVRETRHIQGVHVLTGREYVNAFHFPDAIARCSHPIDIHSSQGSDQKCEFLKEAAYIPYRSLIVDDFPNFIVAGRSFSAEREAFASARVQACAMGIGQAAGYAAALICEKEESFHDIDISHLRKTLIDVGANI